MDGTIDPTIHRQSGGAGDWLRAYYESRFNAPPLAQILVAAALWMLTLWLGILLLNHVLTTHPPHHARAGEQVVIRDPS
jgi:hypothetical protein